MKAILKDGKAINLSYEAQELRDLLWCQVILMLSLQFLKHNLNMY